jgi:hypothetical protein
MARTEAEKKIIADKLNGIEAEVWNAIKNEVHRLRGTHADYVIAVKINVTERREHKPGAQNHATEVVH